jgi:hypothetical protein
VPYFNYLNSFEEGTVVKKLIVRGIICPDNLVIKPFRKEKKKSLFNPS